MKKVRVQIPATSANLGPGFDVIGVALKLYNEVSVEADPKGWSSHRQTPSIAMDIRGLGANDLPRDPSNLVVRAMLRVCDKVHRWPRLLRMQLVNRIPLSRGLGSSAAATVGGIVAANALLGKPLKEAELLNLATAMEGHPDNVTPALVGGFCISGLVNHEVRHLKFAVPSDLRAVVCSPSRSLATSEARRVLPSRIPFSAAVFTSARVAFLVGALVQRKYEWLSYAMEDILHQPARAALIPGLADVIRAAVGAGAWGSALSGAGSSVIALSKPSVAKAVGRAMEKAFADEGLNSHAQVLMLENSGVKIS
jgi:homoserine kinase